MGKFYRDYADFLADHFPGKMQKLAVNAGFSCPNRDGTIGRGGCTYCNNASFNPSYCDPKGSVTAQIQAGKTFFARKYPAMRYLAYFQAYTNTHAAISRLLPLYEEALAVDGVDGIIIGTRPDCMPDELLRELAGLHSRHWVAIEYGAETSFDTTLRLINRCHSWSDTCRAVERTAAAGLPVGLHLIAGLPGENRDHIIHTIRRVAELPVDTVKIHQLQVLRGTRLAADLANGLYDIPRFTLDEYLDLCAEIIHTLPPHIAIERFLSASPPEMLLYPKWGLKNYQFTHLLHSRLRQRTAH